MRIGLIDHTVKLQKVLHIKNPVQQTTDPCFQAKRPEALLDLVELSAQFKKHAPTKGLSIEETAGANEAERGELHIGPVPPDVQQYFRCRDSVEKGRLNDFFFYLDSGSIQAQAEQILSGGTYNPNDLSSSVFIRGVCEWFGEDDISAVSNSFEALVKEYAGYLLQGETPGVDKLQTKFSIAGEEITLGQIFQIRDVAQALKAVNYGISSGTNMYMGFAKMGLIKAAAKQYATTLPEGLGQPFYEKFCFGLDNSKGGLMQDWKQNEYYSGGILKEYHAIISNTAEYAYALFSDFDFTQSDFSERLSKLTQSFSGYFHPDTAPACRREATGAYTELCRALGLK